MKKLIIPAVILVMCFCIFAVVGGGILLVVSKDDKKNESSDNNDDNDNDNDSNNNSDDNDSNDDSGDNGSDNDSANTTKPAGWPDDVPTLNGGKDYAYAKYANKYYLSYNVSKDNKSVKDISDSVVVLLKDKGWATDEEATLETSEGVIRTLSKGNDVLLLTIGKASTSNDDYIVSIVTGPKD